MSKIKFAETFKDGNCHEIRIDYADEHVAVGFDLASRISRPYSNLEPSIGRCLSDNYDRMALIIPPSLPWEWIVGDWYKCQDGTTASLRNTDEDRAWLDSDSGTICVWSECGKVFSSERHPSDIVAHLGPLPQGVYHVSDGDTQLLRDLKRWQDRGGKVESRYTDERGNWGQAHSRNRLTQRTLLYRAHGCTDDREFPQPEPKPDPLDRVVTIRDMIALRHYLNGECSHGDPCVNFWNSRAESQP